MKSAVLNAAQERYERDLKKMNDFHAEHLNMHHDRIEADQSATKREKDFKETQKKDFKETIREQIEKNVRYFALTL